MISCAQVQKNEQIRIEEESNSDSIAFFRNKDALCLFYQKLDLLEQNQKRKINIVHIGDSHIQADIFTAKIRNGLQAIYGNGGFGFTFPYRVAKTNNSAPINYLSVGNFESCRNSLAESSKQIGLSGLALETKNKNFVIQLQVENAQYNFTKLKIITPNNANMFAVATDTLNLDDLLPTNISHLVKPGEFLGGIASKYGVSITNIKRINNLKNDIIRDGQLLEIPSKQTHSTTNYTPIQLQESALYRSYVTSKPTNKILIVPTPDADLFGLNGLVLENDKHGIIYHSIGVNGAKASDYNKFSLFKEQLPVLNPDLVIISLGTNESYNKLSKADYFIQIEKMIAYIKEKSPETCILVTTPPPSILLKKYHNTYIEEYADIIKDNATTLDYAVWDLLDIFGGNEAIDSNSQAGYMATDQVHYSKEGYEKQGEMFVQTFVKSYEQYKLEK